MGAVALIGAFVMVRPDLMLVERVEFVGAERAQARSLRHLADIRNGATIWSVDAAAVQRGVERHPWVESARVRRIFPDTVRVELTERTPVALLRTDRLHYVDGNGVVFLEADGTDLDYPIISGVDEALAARHPQLPVLAIRDALSLIDDLDRKGLVLRSGVSEVAFASTRGFTVHTQRGARIRFGLDDRARQVTRLAALIARDVDLGSPVLVDLAPKSVAIVRPIEGPVAGS